MNKSCILCNRNVILTKSKFFYCNLNNQFYHFLKIIKKTSWSKWRANTYIIAGGESSLVICITFRHFHILPDWILYCSLILNAYLSWLLTCVDHMLFSSSLGLLSLCWEFPLWPCALFFCNSLSIAERYKTMKQYDKTYILGL